MRRERETYWERKKEKQRLKESSRNNLCQQPQPRGGQVRKTQRERGKDRRKDEGIDKKKKNKKKNCVPKAKGACEEVREQQQQRAKENGGLRIGSGKCKSIVMLYCSIFSMCCSDTRRQLEWHNLLLLLPTIHR